MPDRIDETLDLIAKLERSGDSAVSPKGAVGKFQVMPDTAKRFGFDPERLTDPAYNRTVARAVVEELDKTYHGNQKAILVGYNASTAVRRRWLASGMDDSVLPQETQDYVVRGGYGHRPQRAPEPPTMSPGSQRIQAMIDGGMPQAQIDAWRIRTNAAFQQGGLPEEEITKYWGDKEAALKPVDDKIKENIVANVTQSPEAAQKIVETPFQAFEYGLQMSDAGLLLRGRKPDRVMPQDAGLWNSTIAGLTTGIADLPYFIGGFVGGAAAGAPAGPAGAIGGAVVGSAALPSVIRNTLFDQYDHPDGNKTWRDFAGRVGKGTMQTIKETTAGAFGFFLGGKTGTTLLKAGAKPIIAGASSLISSALGQVGASSAMEGHVPTSDEALAATIMTVGMHGAAKVGERVFATKSGEKVQKNFQDAYRATGLRPLQIAELMNNDPVIQAEMMSRQADGELHTPALDEYAAQSAGEKADAHEETVSIDARRFNRAMDRAQEREDAELGMGRYGSTPKRDFEDQRTANMTAAFGDRPVEEPDLISHAEALTDIQNAIGGRVMTYDKSTGVYRFDGPEGEIIGTYLRTFGELAGFAFRIGPAEKESAAKVGGGPSFMADSAGRHAVFLPNTPQELSRRWYGLGRYEIIHHEVGHAIDLKDIKPDNIKADGWLTYALKHNPELRAEVTQISKEFRSKLWAEHPNYTSRPSELAADTIAAYISNPTVRARMPKFEAFIGDKLKPYLEAAEKALPKQTDGKTWSDAPGFKPEPTNDGNGSEGAGGGGEPPSGGSSGGNNAEPNPRRITGTVEPQDIRAMYDRLSKEILGTSRKRQKSILSFSTIYRQFMTELQAARTADTQLKVGKEEFGVTDAVRRAYNARDLAAHFILKGTSSAKMGLDTNGPAYVDALKAVKEDGGNMEDFNKFRVALRLLELQKRGIVPNDPALSFAGEIVRNAEEQGKYKRGIEMLKEHKDKVVDFGTDAELWDQGRANAMKRLNLAHIRFKVAQEGKIDATDTKRRGFGARNPVFRIQGSAMKLDPELMKNDIENEHYIIQEGLHNLAALELVTRIEKGAEKFGDLVPARRVSIEDMRVDKGDVTDAAGNPIDPNSPEAKAVAPFVALRKASGRMNDRSFHVFRNGRLEIWEAESPELARLFRSVHSTGEMNIIATGLEKFANLQRLGVVTAPDFTMRSLFRSEIEATITSAHPQPYPGHDLFHGLLDVLKLREPYLDMIRKGAGEGATVTGMFRDVTKDELREIFVATGRESRMWNVFKHPIDALRTFKSRLLAASQVGYYKRVSNMGIDPRKAAMEARETYRDPQEKAGLAALGWLDKFTPFLRVSRLDVDQFIQNVKRNPGKVFAYGLAYATIPTVINWAANYIFDETTGKDPQWRAENPGYRPYSEYTRFERDLYYVLPPVFGVRARLPLKPFVSGFLFSSAIERTLDALVKHDPRAMKDWAQTFMAQVVPPIMPAMFMPIWEQATNTRAYSGRPLIPAALERLSPTMQYTPDTTETAKALSKFMSADYGILSHLHMGVDVAPVVVDNYIRELGTMPVQLLKTLEMTLGKAPAHPWTIADIPFVRSFIAIEPGMTSQPIQDFYDESADVLKKQADLQEARKRQNIPEFMDAYADQRRALVGRVNSLRDVLANKAQIINAININKHMTDPEKVKAIDAQYSSMVLLSKTGLQMLDSVKKLK